MSSHALQATNSTLFAIRDFVASRNVGDGIRSEASTVNLIVDGATILGNNVGVDAVAGTIRINNVGIFHNNTNLTNNVLSS